MLSTIIGIITNKEVILMRFLARTVLSVMIHVSMICVLCGGSVYNPIPPLIGDPREIIVPDGISISYSLAQSDVWEFTEHYYNSVYRVRDLLSEPARIIAGMSYPEYYDHFGLIPDAETAAKVGAIVHHETHEGCECSNKLIVGLNKTANTWIVSGNPIDASDFYGGTMTLAILKATGQVILLYHNK